MEVGQNIILYGQRTEIEHICESREMVVVNPSVIVPDIEYQKDSFDFDIIESAIRLTNKLEENF